MDFLNQVFLITNFETVILILIAGGMRCRELFSFLRALKGINVIGGEVNEFTPEYDSNEVTAHACAQGAYEIMCLALDNVEDLSE